jgi:hypothetical protein
VIRHHSLVHGYNGVQHGKNGSGLP